MSATDQKCPRCLDEHPIIRCPYVKAVEFEFGWDGNHVHAIKRIEFLVPADYGRPAVPPTKDEPAQDSYPKMGPR